jgi:polysaccharide biosynthesis transport protein
MIANQLSLSGQGTPSVEVKPAAEIGSSAHLHLLQIIRRRKGRILIAVLLTLGLAAAYCALTGPQYESAMQLLVIKKNLVTAPITGPDQVRAPDDFLSTHMLIITSRKVIGGAIEKGNLQDLKQFQTKGGLKQEVTDWVSRTVLGEEPEVDRQNTLVTNVIRTLQVTRDAQRPGINPSNEVLNLSFRGNVAADCPTVLNAISASYQEFLKETFRNTNAETVELIAQARTTVLKDLEVKEAAYQKFLAETPPLWRPEDRSTAHQDHLFKIDSKLAALRMRRSEIEASVAMIENVVRSGRNPTATVLRMLASTANGDGAAAVTLAGQDNPPPDRRARVSLEEELVSLQLVKAKLGSNHAKNHADVLAVDRQIASLRRMMLPSVAETNGDSSSEPDRTFDLGAIKVELLKQELEDLKVAELALAQLFDKEQSGVSASYIHEIQNETHRKGIERDRLLYDGIVNRLKETSSVRDFGGYNTQVIGPALPGQLTVRRYLLVFGLSVFAGLLIGFGWAYLAEAAARRSPTTAHS